MSENDRSAAGQVTSTAAEVYAEFFVPALFAQFTGPVLDAAGVGPGDAVLDVGCGTGVLAVAASGRTAGGRVAGVDRNAAMLAVAGRSAEAVEWHPGRAEALPFADSTFDRVVSQFAIMFFDDRAAATEELARVLVPGGTVAVATWAAIEESPGYAVMAELLRATCGDGAAAALRAPFCLGTATQLREVLAPKFPDCTVERAEGTARFATIDAWLHTDIRGWTLADAVDEATFAELRDRALVELRRFTDPSGAVRFPAPALIARARRTADRTT